MKLTYKIVKKLTIEELEAEVDNLIKKGYNLLGFPFQYHDNYEWICQAMILREDEK